MDAMDRRERAVFTDRVRRNVEVVSCAYLRLAVVRGQSSCLSKLLSYKSVTSVRGYNFQHAWNGANRALYIAMRRSLVWQAVSWRFIKHGCAAEVLIQAYSEGAQQAWLQG